MRAHLLALALLAACGNGKSAPPPMPGDRPWTVDDFGRLAAGSGCAGLPQPGSPAFDRMIDPSVLAMIDPPGRPVGDRLSSLIDYQGLMSAINKRYIGCTNADAMLALSVMNLEAAAREIPLVDELAATFSPQDPDYAARMDGLAQMKDGVVSMATGASMVVQGGPFASPMPGVGRRLGVALARARDWIGPVQLAGALASLDVAPDTDPDPNRLAIRREIVDGLHAPP